MSSDNKAVNALPVNNDKMTVDSKQNYQRSKQDKPKQEKQQKKTDGKESVKPPQQKPLRTGDAQNKVGNEDKKLEKSDTSKAQGKDSSASKHQAHSSTISSTQVYQLNLFDHLPRKTPIVQPIPIEGDISIHSAILKLGQLYKTGIIRDDDDRVAALCGTFCKVIEDYTTPTNKSFNWDLDKQIKIQVQYLVDHRQISMGMGNIIKYLRSAISTLPPELTEADAKQQLINILKIVIEEKLVYARESITTHCKNLVQNGDVVLTFGSSPLLRQVLLTLSIYTTFHVIIVDCRPLNDGLQTLSVLSPYLKCTYITLASVATLMKDVTHVFLGASSLLSNGSMYAPAGTALIASIAKLYRVPTIIIAETYKFSEKVQLDSIVYNELGNPAEIAYMKDNEAVSQIDLQYRGALEKNVVLTATSSSVDSTSTVNKSTVENIATNGTPFQVINLRYDLCPITNISAIVTETGLIPPTSIPVLIKEFQSDQPISVVKVKK